MQDAIVGAPLFRNQSLVDAILARIIIAFHAPQMPQARPRMLNRRLNFLVAESCRLRKPHNTGKGVIRERTNPRPLVVAQLVPHPDRIRLFEKFIATLITAPNMPND